MRSSAISSASPVSGNETVDTDAAGILRVHRVLGVDEGADATASLGFGHDVADECRLERGPR